MTTPTNLPTPVQLVAVCHTDGCPAQNEEHVNTYYPVGDYDPPRYMGQCGPCQQPITDLRPAPASSADTPPPPPEPDAPAPVPVEPSTT